MNDKVTSIEGGFQWGPVKVIRAGSFSEHGDGAVFLDVITEKKALRIDIGFNGEIYIESLHGIHTSVNGNPDRVELLIGEEAND